MKAAPPPTCPRRAYDLSGSVASWNREDSLSCPVQGTCSECGLTFWWHDAIHGISDSALFSRRRWPGWLVVPSLLIAGTGTVALMVWLISVFAR